MQAELKRAACGVCDRLQDVSHPRVKVEESLLIRPLHRGFVSVLVPVAKKVESIYRPSKLEVVCLSVP